MAEIYTIQPQNGRLEFTPRQGHVPAAALAEKFTPGNSGDNLEVICRMGDPDIIHCAVFRTVGIPGGIFSVYGKSGLLFCAVAESNLAFAMAQGYFGEMVANARYGMDVFENMELPDD